MLTRLQICDSVNKTTDKESVSTNPEAVPAEPEQDLDWLREQLAPFLANNPLATLETLGSKATITKPWGDDTVNFQIPKDPNDVIGILNDLFFPPLYSAIFHKDRGDLEFIFTSRRVEVHGRNFGFNFRGTLIQCEFADVSDRLMKVAAIARPVAPPSHTGHRNLFTFNVKSIAGGEKAGNGTSFWIRGVTWDDVFLLDLARSLNFYMWYFDRESPRILIHERSKLESPGKMPPRYLFDSFPKLISGRPLDAFLLQLWESFVVGNAVHRVLYGYQIIEYVAFYHVQDSISQTIRRVLVSPETLERSTEATRQILEAIAEDKMEDAAKVDKVVELYVDHNQLANAVRRNLGYFSEDVIFDGGFVLPALCSAKWEPTDKKECKEMARRVASSVRKMRNAIAHSRESRNTNSIAPTLSNQDRIYPWLDPVSILVSNLMLYAGSNF